MSSLPLESPSSLSGFHPLLARWFQTTLGAPSSPQQDAWPLIQAGRNVLISAPTGSGKTLAAFLACLDRLFRQALDGSLKEETEVLYISPLKALGNDVRKNLLEPLEQLYSLARAEGLEPLPIRVGVRSGDTEPKERAAWVKRPPHILITTPESLYLYLTAAKSRQTLEPLRTVIVDEIHALARDKRGAHLLLSLERLDTVAREKPQRLGLSATTRPLDTMRAFLCGEAPCEQVTAGHIRPWDIQVAVPEDELSSVATHEMWGQVYEQLVGLSQTHRTLLVFTNTRRLAERVAHDLGTRLGPDTVMAHHGSLSTKTRLLAEEKLKCGQLRVMVATASLELGIDIGSVDCVAQLGSPRAISVALQRIGRAGHRLGGISKGILFALTRDELVECAALVWAIRQGELDRIRMPPRPLDVLAQQVVAEVASREWDEKALFETFKKAWPYRELTEKEFEDVLVMLSEGVAGRTSALLHRDQVFGKLRPRRAARLTALLNGGAIPDTFTCPVVASPEDKTVGTVDEDFAIDSMAGDVFLLGSTSWRIQRVSQGVMRVENAQGAPPSVPFWRGEAPSRTDELSSYVGQLREKLLAEKEPEAFLQSNLGLGAHAASTLVRYLRAGKTSLGVMPSQATVVAERFFDEAGGMQLLLHAPFGGRINRAWGMALRKRFCRTFDFELQAAATDDGVLLSLGEQHSFPLEDVFDFLSAKNVEEVLTQAVLQSPLFGTRFRQTASRALALRRMSAGKRVPPAIQRARSDNLLAAVFPAQVGCQDNHGGGDIEVPDHPLVKETLVDCLYDTMDVPGLKQVLEGLATGRIRKVAADVAEPSVMAHALLNSAPYSFLDEAPLEERRARAVRIRRMLSPEEATSVGALDEAAIAQVVAEAAPEIRDLEELHDALLQFSPLPQEAPFPVPQDGLRQLADSGRATCLVGPEARVFWVAAERVQVAKALFPDSVFSPPLKPLGKDAGPTRDEAITSWVSVFLDMLGPVTAGELHRLLGLSVDELNQALARLEASGTVLRGRFRPSPASDEVEWCHRRLLQRIHRLTVGRLRADIEPLSPQDFMRFLFKWHPVEPQEALRGTMGLKKAVSLLEGYEAPAAAWELHLLPARMKYLPELLDRASWGGDVAWGRLSPQKSFSVLFGPKRGAEASVLLPKARSLGKTASLTFVLRENLDWMLSGLRPPSTPSEEGFGQDWNLSAVASDLVQNLWERGALFFPELVQKSRRLPAEVEEGLGELVSKGLVTADAVDNLRTLLSPKMRRRQRETRRGGPGRWTLLLPREEFSEATRVENLARLFLRRYGIVFRDLLAREPLAPPWRELVYVYRRLELQGEIRGGRFLAGFAGEQFALPEAVERSRQVRKAPKTGQRVCLSAVDPLNLTGIVTPGPRVPATLGQRVTWIDGVPQELKEIRRDTGAFDSVAKSRYG